jgi:hypothetical protein
VADARYHCDKPAEIGLRGQYKRLGAGPNSTAQSKRAQPTAGSHYSAQRGKRHGDGKN